VLTDYFRPDPDAPAFGTALLCVVPAPAPVVNAGADLAGALDPPPLLSAGVFRLEAPAPVAPPVPDELMLEPLLDAPDPLCAPAVDVVIRAAPSASIAITFISVSPVEGGRDEPRGRVLWLKQNPVRLASSYNCSRR